MSASGVSDNLEPGEWHFTRTRGDVMRPTRFAVEIDGEPATTSLLAQVRKKQRHTSDLVLDLEPAASGDYIDVPGTDVTIDVDPGVYFWDLEVDGLTVLAGTFRVHPDVSTEEEGS
jgi:hypothetical protein